MAAATAFKATYSDLRFVKSRKVAQVMLELPIEEADAFVKAFGTPNPASETWVGIARLDLSKAVAPKAKEKRSFAELPIAQQAALLCNREAFWRFLCEREGHNFIPDESAAADTLRSICGVSSRSELSTNGRAAGIFQTLSHEFEDWLREPL